MTRATVKAPPPALRPLLLLSLGFCAFFVGTSAFGRWALFTQGNSGMLPGVDGARLLTAGLGLLLFLTVIATALAHRRHRAWLGIPLFAGFATVTYIGVSKWAEFTRLEFVGFEGVPYEFHVQSALVVDVVAASIGVALSLLLLAQSLRERRARHPTVPSPSALES